MAEQKIRYVVKKETEHRKMCTTCGGVGSFQSGRKCPECENGVCKHWHTTEVSLMDALKELGLIKETGDGRPETEDKNCEQ